MPVINLRAFGGMIPKLDNWQLPEPAAKVCTNNVASGGSLKPINKRQKLADLGASTRRVYRIPTGDHADISQSFWWEFDDPDTTVVRTPISNDQFERYYWASPSHPLRYNTRARIIAGSTDYIVGVEASATAPNVDAVAGTEEQDENGDPVNPVVTRSYVITFVSVFGEESQPSPPAEVVAAIDQTVLVSSIPQPDPDPPATAVPIEKIRIYRTVTALSGTTTFFRVDELLVGNTTYTDVTTDTQLVTQIESTIWAAPPDMDGVVAMPNGVFVGFKDNTLFFSENYRPHAWPAEYQITVEYPIVGLGVFGQTCVVCTEGHPAAVTGTRADSMTLITNTAALPCVSRGSIVSTVAGVIYASENGLVLFGPGGISMLSDGLFGRYDWNEEYAPTTIRATASNNNLIAVHAPGGTPAGFMLNPLSQPEGVIGLDGITATGIIQVDPWSGRALLVQDAELFEFIPSTGDPEKLVWRSKDFQVPYPLNFGVARIFYDPYEGPALASGEVIGRLRIRAGYEVVYDEPFPEPSKVFRLPSGFKEEIWSIEVESRVRVHAVQIASTAEELRDV